MFKLWNRIFLTPVFFITLFCVGVGFIFAFVFDFLLPIITVALLAFLFLTFLDFFLLISKKNGITGNRIVADKLSNSDENQIQIQIRNLYIFPVFIRIIEELPNQFQQFNLNFKAKINHHKSKTIDYKIRPIERGEYIFHNTIVMAKTPLKLLALRYELKTEKKVKVYPSFLQLKKFDLLSLKAKTQDYGSKKVGRIGNSLEFEQIKNYTPGDDVRTINWKATAKHGKFMVNQYVDEKSQQVYCVVDKGRVMKMPFNNLSLLDYALNTSLVVSNIVLQNQDKAGFFTFSSSIENFLKASRKNNQMLRVLDTLYNVRTNFKESDFGKLYGLMKSTVTQRSLILLFTNFESMDALHRQLPYLKAMNRAHILVTVFFRNTELETFAEKDATTAKEIYEKSIAEKFIYEKQLIVRELQKNGILTILSKPEDLTINSLNKYLEIKSKAMI